MTREDYSYLYAANGKLSSTFIKRAKEAGKLDSLIELTSFLPEDSPISVRLYHHENQLSYRPTCKMCGNLLEFVNDKFKGYKDTCSAKCSGAYRKQQNLIGLPEEALKYKLSQYQIDFFKTNPGTEWPTCKCGCGEKVLLDVSNPQGLFRKYASEHCSRKDKTVPKNVLALLSNREWLYDQRVNQKKSIALIAKEQGISSIPVAKWCKIFDINIRLNESNPDVKMLLDDKDWLFDQHVLQGKQCSKIAKEINTSLSTVSIHLAKQGIKANNSNEYPRIHIVVSKGHQEVVDYIKSIYDGEVIINDRSVLNGKELDIYIPDLSFAIEYNGVYSHLYRPREEKDSQIKGRHYHKDKTNTCKSKNIHLMQIWSSQWRDQQDIIKSIISQKLGLCSNKIYARKTQIVEIDAYTKNRFLEANHLQGQDKSMFKYGLMHNEELVAVMTFSKSRFNKSYDWELSRYSVKQNTSVVGGFSKMLKHFRRYNQGSIISYADMMYSNGNVYRSNGFELIHETKASYWYVRKNSETLEHRSKFMKKNITNDPNDPRTEAVIMEQNGYNKIFDCGLLVFILRA